MHTLKLFQVLLCMSHNSISVICLHTNKIICVFAHTVCSIWPIDRTLLGTTIPSQSRSGSNGNEEVIHILQISKVREIRRFNVISRKLVGWGSYPSEEMQSVYSTALANWATVVVNDIHFLLYNAPLEIIKSWFLLFRKKLMLYKKIRLRCNDLSVILCTYNNKKKFRKLTLWHNVVVTNTIATTSTVTSSHITLGSVTSIRPQHCY